MALACVVKQVDFLYGGNMLVVSQKASEEINKVLAADDQKGKRLILYFQGSG